MKKPRPWFGGACMVAMAIVACAAPSRSAQAVDRASVVSPATNPSSFEGGNHRRELKVDGRSRSYQVHIPPSYDRSKPTPVVLAFHGLWMNALMMERFTGLSNKSDAAGFIVVYPNGVGLGEAGFFFNAWAAPGPAGDGPPDDVAFTTALLDDLAALVNVDPRRVFATGMSNGGMMCHRLAAEMPWRFAAIAPVAGTVASPQFKPKSPMPVLQIHGTADWIVPFDLPEARRRTPFDIRDVAETIDLWVHVNDCVEEPEAVELSDRAEEDGTRVTRKTYAPQAGGAEVVLIQVTEGGHTWPGQRAPLKRLGRTTMDVNANDLIWDFFQRHPKR